MTTVAQSLDALDTHLSEIKEQAGKAVRVAAQPPGAVPERIPARPAAADHGEDACGRRVHVQVSSLQYKAGRRGQRDLLRVAPTAAGGVAPGRLHAPLVEAAQGPPHGRLVVDGPDAGEQPAG